MSEGTRFPENFDPEDPEDYIRQLAHDSDLLASDPEFRAWVETLDKELDDEKGF